MSRQGAPALDVGHAGDLKVAVVAASWHQQIMDGLIAGAQRALAETGLAEPVLVRVPGTFELPVAAKHAAAHGYHAIICLGVVIRGDTPHFGYVCTAATTGLTAVATDTGIPVGFGVLTCDDEQQALDRAGLPNSHEDKGHEAATAAIATALALRAFAQATKPTREASGRPD